MLGNSLHGYGAQALPLDQASGHVENLFSPFLPWYAGPRRLTVPSGIVTRGQCRRLVESPISRSASRLGRYRPPKARL
jgi:hypothetical protein